MVRATAYPTALCGSRSSPVSARVRRIVSAVSASSVAAGVEFRPDQPQFALADGEGAGLREALHQAADIIGVAAMDLEEQAFEIARDLDIHRRAGRGRHALHVIAPGLEGAVEDVVDVGGDHQPVDGHAHALGDEAGEDVAEVPGRHAETDLAVGSAERDGRRHIIDGLGQDTGPVDGIHTGEAHRVAEAVIVEQRLHDRLAVVEVALHGDVVNIRRQHRRHLPALHVADLAMRMQDEDRRMAAVAEGLDGSAAGIAGRGADDGGPPVMAGERPVHQPRQQLHGHVLEGQCRTMEEFQQPLIVVELLQGRHGGMAEGGIGFGDHGLQLGLGNRARHERRENRKGHLFVALAAQAAEIAGGELGPAGRDVEAAVTGKPGEQHFLEPEFRSLAPGGHITHAQTLSDFALL